jgi:hypothetical protein
MLQIDKDTMNLVFFFFLTKKKTNLAYNSLLYQFKNKPETKNTFGKLDSSGKKGA